MRIVIFTKMESCVKYFIRVMTEDRENSAKDLVYRN